MIYTIEKRSECDKGILLSHYEVRSYTRRTSVGILIGGKTLKTGTKSQCEKYCRVKGIKTEEI